MTPGPRLEAGERVLRSWPARSLGNTTTRASSGELVLTTQAIRFEPRPGLFGGARSGRTGRRSPLEHVASASPHRSELRIGYGDRVVFEGVIVAGITYEFGQGIRSRAVLEEIAVARQLRRRELGLPDDLAPCRSCGRWIATESFLCPACSTLRSPSR